MSAVSCNQLGAQLLHGGHQCGHPIIVEGNKKQHVAISPEASPRDSPRDAATLRPANHGVPRDPLGSKYVQHHVFEPLPTDDGEHLHDLLLVLTLWVRNLSLKLGSMLLHTRSGLSLVFVPSPLPRRHQHTLTDISRHPIPTIS